MEARSHECAIAAFEAFYIKNKRVGKDYLEYVKKAKKLSEKYSDSLEYAKAERIKASYGLEEITSQEANKVLGEARDFVTEIKGIVSKEEGFGYKKM